MFAIPKLLGDRYGVPTASLNLQYEPSILLTRRRRDDLEDSESDDEPLQCDECGEWLEDCVCETFDADELGLDPEEED
jgi:hypothetical protein